MNLYDARVYAEGVRIGQECEEKIRQIVKTVKTISPSSDVSMRFVKNGNIYEGLLWGQVDRVPLGAYNRGQSMAHVLETFHKKIKKECLKIWKLQAPKIHKERPQFRGPTPMVIADEKEKLIDLTGWNSEEFFKKMKKIAKNVNDLVLVPAAVIALMAL